MDSIDTPEVLAAIPTAFDADGRLDLDGCRSIIKYLSSSDVDGFFVAGTAGEFPALNRTERRLVAEVALETTPADKRVVLHVGAASAYEVLALLDDARELGIRDVAVITPYFLPANRDSLREFYRRVSEGSEGLRVYPYLYAALCGNSVDEDLLGEIAALPHLAGAKISGESPRRVGRYVKATPPGFDVYAGADQELVAMLASGARGIVSAMSACLPGPFTRLAAAAAAGSGDDMARWQLEVDDVCTVIAGSIARTKIALRLQGIAAGSPRMAVEMPNDAAATEIERIVKLYA